MSLLLIPRFENILKRGANPVTLKKSLKIIGRKPIISNFNKMQTLLKASKADRLLLLVF